MNDRINVENEIRYIEEISLNAWPSHKMELYDGWLIRYSHEYTYRTNSVAQVGASTIPVPEKITYCEEVYRGFHSACNFKISPLTDPDFDTQLAQRGYQSCQFTDVMTADLSAVTLMEPSRLEYRFSGGPGGLPACVHYGEGEDRITVLLEDVITDEWIGGVFHLNGTCDPVLRRIVPSMYKAIPKRTIAASVEIEGRIVATGLAICDREYAGIYAIYVSPGCRRRHYARTICSTLLREAKEAGAERAYLQVAQGNDGAKKLYQSLGFADFYSYYFRSKKDGMDHNNIYL